MKRFLLISVSLVLLAVAMVVGIWVWLQAELQRQTQVLLETPSSVPLHNRSEAVATSSATTSRPEPVVETTTTPSSIPTESIPLRSLPLSESQRSSLELVGLDVESMVITPEMITCAQDALGEERLSEIIAGAQPGVADAVRLAPCVN